ncbi:MAG: flagellar hook-length control protein FliK [Enterobacteriaceae bacterium]|jgi:flagellar hook-length control protein FliK|nr:flagellar hook-length control protein FliK [Enterobacteriaceae bacterium]
MNLTLLPTDLTLKESVTGKAGEKMQQASTAQPDNLTAKDTSSEFKQMLSAETEAQQKAAAQGTKLHSDNGDRTKDSSATSSTEKKFAPVSIATGKLAKPESPASADETETASQEEDEDPLSAETLINTIPIQLVELINRQPATGTAGSDDHQPDANNGTETIFAGKSGKQASVESVLNTTESAEQTEESLSADSARAFLTPENGTAQNRPTLAAVSGKTKAVALKTNTIKSTVDRTGENTASAAHGKEHIDRNPIGTDSASVQGSSLSAAASANTSPTNTPYTLAASPLLASGHQANGQFQINGNPAPLLSAQLGSEEWQQQLNQQVLFFNRNGLQQAELRLHPQELGALHIRLNVEDNQAQLHFIAAHQHVRDALEAALPTLRHALAENGIQLAQSSVNSDTADNWQQLADQRSDQTSGQQQHKDTEARVQRDGAPTVTPATHESAIRVTPAQLASSRGGVDTFV